MFTKNFTTFCNDYLLTNWYSSQRTLNFIDYEGNSVSYTPSSSSYAYILANYFNQIGNDEVNSTCPANSGKLFIKCGLNNTEETYNDYTLNSIISSSSLAYISSSMGNGATGKVFYTTFQNISNEDIIINEIGLFFKFNSDYVNNSTSFCGLFYRETIPGAITVKPNEIVTIPIDLFFI